MVALVEGLPGLVGVEADHLKPELDQLRQLAARAKQGIAAAKLRPDDLCVLLSVHTR